jgi:hypothetical protein
MSSLGSADPLQHFCRHGHSAFRVLHTRTLYVAALRRWGWYPGTRGSCLPDTLPDFELFNRPLTNFWQRLDMMRAHQLLGVGSNPSFSGPSLALTRGGFTPIRAANPSPSERPPMSTAWDSRAPHISLLNSITSSLSRLSKKIRPFPHEYSNPVRCSDRRSSSRLRSTSRSRSRG